MQPGGFLDKQENFKKTANEEKRDRKLLVPFEISSYVIQLTTLQQYFLCSWFDIWCLFLQRTSMSECLCWSRKRYRTYNVIRNNCLLLTFIMRHSYSSTGEYWKYWTAADVHQNSKRLARTSAWRLILVRDVVVTDVKWWWWCWIPNTYSGYT